MLAQVSKAIAGSLAGAATGVGMVAITVPDTAPWWGYLLAGVANAAIGFVSVYLAPKNKV